MVSYDDTNISYGCIIYLREKMQQNCKPKKAELKIILATLFKFHTQKIVKLKEDEIIFNKAKISKESELEENEKLIYKFLKSLSQNNKLKIEDFIDPPKELYLEYRDKFIDLDENIEYDLNNNNYYEKRIINLGRKKLNKRIEEYMKSFEENLNLTKDIINGKIEKIEFDNIKNCAKISISTGISKKFLEVVKNLDFEHKTEFIKYMQNYLKIFQLRENMNKNEEIIQSELKARNIKSTEAFKGISKF